MFSREVVKNVEVTASANVLPVRGSNHPAFVEMLFLWGDSLLEDCRFRTVVLPAGFYLQPVDENIININDMHDFTRARLHNLNSTPSIAPMKRFTQSVAAHGGTFKGLVMDWSEVVYRTPSCSDQSAAMQLAAAWLDEYKPRWDSYVAAVNFERKIPG